jgi:predicted ester cyclase
LTAHPPGSLRAHLANHAAGPQGGEGLKRILRTSDADLGPVTAEQHHLVGEGDIVAQHLTLHGIHRASTMPLLANETVSGRRVAWTFIHLWRVVDDTIVEHWACRDDLGGSCAWAAWRAHRLVKTSRRQTGNVTRRTIRVRRDSAGRGTCIVREPDFPGTR